MIPSARRLVSTGAVLALLALLGAAWFVRGRLIRPAPVSSGGLAGWNLLLVTIDTLRADRVGAYGSGRGLTPTLDALAARAVRFDRAYAHAPMTLPAHASILTGLIPPAHGVRNNGSFRLDASRQTLATCLRRAGYRTGAFVGAFVLDVRFGLNHGFDVYDDQYGTETGPVTFGFVERPANEVLTRAAGWILGEKGGRASTPFFAWVHLFDPHAPYQAPRMQVADPYDNEVAFTDAEIGSFLGELDAAGQLDRTLIIVVADHGEALGDHGEATHGLFAYDATLRIPLIIAATGIRPRVVRAPVSQVDILPTVLDLVGVPTPPAIQGRSVLGALGGATADDRPIYFEALDANLTRNWAPLTGVISDGWKYVDLPVPELYDLARDPGETNNLAAHEAARLRTLQQQLEDLRARVTDRAAAPAPIDADAAARLRALGYTAAQAPAGSRKSRFSEADDPKNLIDLHRDYERALTLAGQREPQAAIDLLRSVIQRRPDFTAAYMNAASILIETGQAAAAVALLDEATRNGLATPELTARQGAAYLAAAEPARAAAVLAPLVADGRGDLDAMNAFGIACWQLGRTDEARRIFQRALDVDPSAAGTWNNLGLLEMAAGRAGEAAAAFERAVGTDPTYGPGWQGLGAARVGRDGAGAIDAWKRAVELVPNDYDILFNLAVLLADSDRPRDALPYLRRFLEEAPQGRYAEDLALVRKRIAEVERASR